MSELEKELEVYRVLTGIVREQRAKGTDEALVIEALASLFAQESLAKIQWLALNENKTNC